MGNELVDLRSQSNEMLGRDGVDVLDRAGTLVDALRRVADRHGDFVALRILDRNGNETRVSVGDLWGRARRLQAHFVNAGLERGSLAIVSLPTGLELLAAYFGVLLAGGVPGLVASPTNRFADRSRYAARVTGILQNAKGRILYCEDQCLDLFHRAGAGEGNAVIAPAETVGAVSEMPIVESDPQTLAMVQYSSGATGPPKGVLISHRAVLANLSSTREVFQMTASDVNVNWLPLYHDMGLVGSFLLPLFTGSPAVLIPTLDFMKEPKLWLWAVHHYRGTVSWAPNFAFSYCAKRIPKEDVEGLDLSSWRMLINGSEPVLASTVEEFQSRYAAHGFSPKAMQTGWGLAESVCQATGTDLSREMHVERVDRAILARDEEARPTTGDGLPIYSMGKPLRDCAIEIRDSAGRVLPERRLGRVWLRSPFLFVGYHGQPELTAEALRDGWLDTGDRGYMADGEFYFVSRDKDLIIIGGEKYVPHDIESVISDVPGVRRGCVAAFGVVDERLGTEVLVAVVETHEEDPGTLERLRTKVGDEVRLTFGLGIRHLIVAPPGSIEKTTSGKVSRLATRQRYERDLASGGLHGGKTVPR